MVQLHFGLEEMSRNLMTIRLAREVGLDIIAEYAEKFGVYDNMKEFLQTLLVLRKQHYIGW